MYRDFYDYITYPAAAAPAGAIHHPYLDRIQRAARNPSTTAIPNPITPAATPTPTAALAYPYIIYSIFIEGKGREVHCISPTILTKD